MLRTAIASAVAALGLLPTLAAAQTYPIQSILSGSDQVNAYYGFDVAVSGTTAIIGAPGPIGFSAGPHPGHAWVHVRDDGGDWRPIVTLTGPTNGGASFGRSVAIDGDLAVVGAPRAVINGSTVGAGYVFERNAAGAWLHVTTLTVPGADFMSDVGWSVDIDGEQVVLGAPGGVNAAPTYKGLAHLFERQPNGVWKLDTTFTSPNVPGVTEDFGYAVSLSGSWLAISDPRSNSILSKPGAVHMFVEVGADWIVVDNVEASDGTSLDQFGLSVEVDGERLIVGSPLADEAGFNSGAAYIYEIGLAVDWNETTKLLPPSPTSGGQFGAGVAVDGNSVAVTARNTAFPSSDIAAGYWYDLSDSGTWELDSGALAPSPTPNLFLPPTAAIDNGRLLLGFPGDGEAAAGAGRTELFYSYDVSGAVAPLTQGTGTPGCFGATQSMAQTKPSFIGTDDYALRAAVSPANSSGLLLLGTVADVNGSDPLGFGLTLHIDPASLLPTIPIASDAFGVFEQTLPIASDTSLVGIEVHAQSFWFWGNTCSLPSAGFSSSRLLTLTLLAP